MKTKMIYCNFDKETGISTVILKNKYGEFKGTSTLLEEDKYFESEFAGCGFAETKAQIKWMKVRLQEMRLKIKSLKEFRNELKCNPKTDLKSYEYIRLCKKIRALEKDAQSWKDKIISLEESNLKSMDNHIKTVKKLRDKANKRR